MSSYLSLDDVVDIDLSMPSIPSNELILMMFPPQQDGRRTLYVSMNYVSFTFHYGYILINILCNIIPLYPQDKYPMGAWSCRQLDSWF